MRYAAKTPYYQQIENFNQNEMTRNEFQKEVDEDRNARIRYESDVRSSCRRKHRIQKQADKEFLTAEIPLSDYLTEFDDTMLSK